MEDSRLGENVPIARDVEATVEQDPNRPLRDEDMETVGAGGIAARTRDADTQDSDQADDADTQDADGTDQADDADTQDSDSDSRDS